MILAVKNILIDNFNIKYDNKIFKLFYYNDVESYDEYFNIFGNVYVGDILICYSNSDKMLKYCEVIEILDFSEVNNFNLMEFRICGKINRVCFDYFKSKNNQKILIDKHYKKDKLKCYYKTQLKKDINR